AAHTRHDGRTHAPLPHEAAPLRILTWNIGKVYLGGRNDSRAADADLSRVAQVIADESPDLVALQELRDRRQLDRLLADLHGAYLGTVPADEINDRRVAALVRRGCAERAAFSEIVTSTGRAVALARVEVGGRNLSFVALHLDAFDPQLRRAQTEEIVD